MMALMPVVDRYGPAIEWDLRERWQVDLHEYFRGGRPWRQLARFLSQLPRTSRFVIAKKNDPEVALEIARALREAKSSGSGVGQWSPPPEEWDTPTELLASIHDRLGELSALIQDLPIAGKKRKAKPPKRTPRPRYAIDKAEQVLSDEHVAEIIEDVEAGKVSEMEYLRIAAEVEEERRRAEEERTETVASTGGDGAA